MVFRLRVFRSKHFLFPAYRSRKFSPSMLLHELFYTFFSRNRSPNFDSTRILMFGLSQISAQIVDDLRGDSFQAEESPRIASASRPSLTARTGSSWCPVKSGCRYLPTPLHQLGEIVLPTLLPLTFFIKFVLFTIFLFTNSFLTIISFFIII